MCQTPPPAHLVSPTVLAPWLHPSASILHILARITNLGLVWDSDGDNIIHHLLASVADHQTADHFLAFCFCKPNVHLII